MYLILKRMVDILFAVALLGLLSPLFIFIMLVLRLTGDFEVFYRQKRIGEGESEFLIWKFVTMRKGSHRLKSGAITLDGDPRVTRLGKFLRSSKLNEFPQLFNVLAGHMSLVGPRPLIRKSFDLYPGEVQTALRALRPGITGIGSIVFRNEAYLLARSKVNPQQFYQDFILPYKGQLERWYFENRSLRTDFLLLALTVHALFWPSSPDLIFRVFPSLPERPAFLHSQPDLNWTPATRKRAIR